MPRACCLLRISGDCQSRLLFSLFLSIELLCRSRKNTSPLLLSAVSTESWTTPMMKVFPYNTRKNFRFFYIRSKTFAYVIYFL